MRTTEKKLEEISSFVRDDYQDVYATARMAHMGQKRRDGKDYFTHPSEVRNLTRKYYPSDKVAQMAALLHDSLEDAPGSTVDSIEEMEQYIRGSIRSASAAEEVIETVRALTHTKGENYTEYVMTLLSKPTALRVKLVDMLHNLSSTPTPRQKKKYETALLAMKDASGGIPGSISTSHWKQLMSLTETKRMKITKNQLRSIIRETFWPDEWVYTAGALEQLASEYEKRNKRRKADATDADEDDLEENETHPEMSEPTGVFKQKKMPRSKAMKGPSEIGSSLDYSGSGMSESLRKYLSQILKEESYYSDLPKHHVDGQPWGGSLEDLAYHQGRTWGHGDMVDPKGYEDQINKSVRLARGDDKSPLRLSEKGLKKLVKEILRKELIR
jgi:hypothetical protein